VLIHVGDHDLDCMYGVEAHKTLPIALAPEKCMQPSWVVDHGICMYTVVARQELHMIQPHGHDANIHVLINLTCDAVRSTIGVACGHLNGG